MGEAQDFYHCGYTKKFRNHCLITHVSRIPTEGSKCLHMSHLRTTLFHQSCLFPTKITLTPTGMAR